MSDHKLFVPPTGISVYVKDGDTDKCIEMAVKQWYAECPDEVVAFSEQQELARANLKNDMGMNETGTMARMIEVPTSLASRITKMIGTPQWMRPGDDNKLSREVKLLIKHCPLVLTRKQRRHKRSIIT